MTIIKQFFFQQIIMVSQNLKFGPNMGLNVPTPLVFVVTTLDLIYYSHTSIICRYEINVRGNISEQVSNEMYLIEMLSQNLQQECYLVSCEKLYTHKTMIHGIYSLD